MRDLTIRDAIGEIASGYALGRPQKKGLVVLGVSEEFVAIQL